MAAPPIPEYADVTSDTAPDQPPGVPGRPLDTGAPRLADRLSALVGQAATRQEDSVSAERLIAAIAARVDAATAELRDRITGVEAGQSDRMTALESLVDERLSAIETALRSPAEGADAGVKSHVDEVGGALVLRLDEVLSTLTDQAEGTRSSLAEVARAGAEESRHALAGQLDEARHQLATQLEDARGQLAGQVDEVRGQLATQVEESHIALTGVVAGFDETIRGHVGDLAAGVLELNGNAGLTRADLDDALVDLRADVQGVQPLLDGMAQAAQLDGVTATTAALREQLDEVAVGLAGMRAEFDGLQAAIERRVDDAALALAETLVAVITSVSVPSAPAISYGSYEYAEGGEDGGWAAADPTEELVGHVSTHDAPAGLDEAAVAEESDEQGLGVDEGGIGSVDLTDPDRAGDVDGNRADGHDAEHRRKGIFRR